jgi:hypothetical protein
MAETYFPEKVKEAYQQFTTPREAYRGGLTPQQEIGFGLRAAGTAAGAGFPLAQRGAVGMAGGKLTQPKTLESTWDSIMETLKQQLPTGATPADKAAAPKYWGSIEDIADKGIDNIKYVAQDFKESYANKIQKTLEKAGAPRLKPLDWQALQNKFIPPASIPKAAQEYGFNPRMVITRGGTGTRRQQMMDPGTEKAHERGVFFGEDPRVAEAYSTTEPPSAGVINYVAAPKNPMIIDLQDAWYDGKSMHRIIEKARGQGADLVYVVNMKDISGSAPRLQNQIVVTDPKILRYPEAKFDPSKFHINDLTAAFAAMLGGAGAVGAARDATAGP